MLRVLIAPIGSAGDVHPYLGLGLALRERGHDVTVVTHGYFEPLLRRAGLPFVELGSAERFLEITRTPHLGRMRVGFRVVAEQAIAPATSELYRIIAERHRPGETVVLAPTIAFGARLAQEKLGVPLATVHIYPFYLRTLHDNPLFPSGVPRAGRALVYRLLDAVVDARLAPPLNAFRAELGLPAVRGIARGWWNSPERVIGLFPDWFGPPQPDWPQQTVLTGFPVYDERRTLATPAEVERFLDAGEPPLVFTTASWMRYARRFFEVSSEVCGLLSRRGLLLTPFPEQLPSRLPTGVCHFASVPYNWLLPRALALVHHGGIGSTASALAAGIPHLVVPMVNDQPDNAARLARLGVARVLRSRGYRARAVAGALAELLGSRDVAARCATLAKEVRESRALEASCRLVEALAEE